MNTHFLNYLAIVVIIVEKSIFTLFENGAIELRVSVCVCHQSVNRLVRIYLCFAITLNYLYTIENVYICSDEENETERE